MYANLIDCDVEPQYLSACIEFIHEMDSTDTPPPRSDFKVGQFNLKAICGLLEIESAFVPNLLSSFGPEAFYRVSLLGAAIIST